VKGEKLVRFMQVARKVVPQTLGRGEKIKPGLGRREHFHFPFCGRKQYLTAVVNSMCSQNPLPQLQGVNVIDGLLYRPGDNIQYSLITS
jgi:hypothetical protein